MIARKYETRLDENGLVTFEKVWSKRMDSYNSNHQFKKPDDVYELCKTLKLDTYAEEHMFLLIFDIQMHFKSFIEIGIGTNYACVFDRRGIAQKVLMLNAGAFIIVHNHPSGDLTPSEADIDAAIKIDVVGQLIYTPMKDFMVIGSETYYSVKENEDI